MRSFPYPAADDPLLAATFGADVVRGLTVLCAAAAGTDEGHWTVVIASSVDGMHALECVRRPDGRTTTSSKALLSQTDWSAILDRAMDAAVGADHFEVLDWMSAQNEMADTLADWDEATGSAHWDRAVHRVYLALAADRIRTERRSGKTDAELSAEHERGSSADPADMRAREIEQAMAEFAVMSGPGPRPN